MSVTPFPNLTPSRAGALVCRKWYYEQHVVKIVPKEEFSHNMTFGIGVHEALKRLTDPSLPTPAKERDIETTVRRAFQGQYYPEASLRETDISRAVPMITRYLVQDAEVNAVLATEVFAEFRIDSIGPRRIAFGAKFDALLSRRDGQALLVVRDYKTGKLRQIDMEAACISIAVAKARLNQFKRDYGIPFSDVILEFDYLSDGGLTDRVVLGVNDVKAVWPDLKARAQFVYSSAEFPPEPGEHCLFCPLRPTCRPNLLVTMNDLDSIFM